VDSSLRLGVDLGGTKTEAVVLRLERDEPEVLARLRSPTNRDAGYDHVVAATAKIICDVTAEAGLSTAPPVGVGMPGSVTYRRADGTRSDSPLTKNSNATVLNGRPFRSDLARALGQPISFANDANCFAIAEATYGAARGAGGAFGVIMGTGVGGGIVFRTDDGTSPAAEPIAWDGMQGIAGEWGHVALDPVLGPPCYCGRRGCVETYLSGPAIERSYARRTGTQRSLLEISNRVDTDVDAKTTLDATVDVFGRAIATVINVLDPDTVVLGGGVSNLAVLYQAGLDAVARWIFNDEVRTKIVKHSLGDSAGVIGAALLP
jgi:fructokinase